MSCGLYKDHNFHRIIQKRFISDALHNGMNSSVKTAEERTRRYTYEKEQWIGNPQFGTYSLLLGFNKKHR